MEKSNNWIIFDGKFIDKDQPAVPVKSRGLMYGDGVFETFRTYNGKVFLLEEHLERLKSGLNFLGIPYPKKLALKRLKSLIFQLLLKKNQLRDNVIIRLQVWRDGGRGYVTPSDAASHFSIITSACPAKFQTPRLVTVSQKRIPSEALPSDYKFTNSINYILASQQSVKKGGDDALMQTMKGWISETTIANIFWVQERTIFTPSTNCDLLPGITRKVLLNLIQKSDEWELSAGKFKLNQFYDAEAAWISNSVREIVPVKQVDDHNFDINHPVINKIREQYMTFRDNKLKPLS